MKKFAALALAVFALSLPLHAAPSEGFLGAQAQAGTDLLTWTPSVTTGGTVNVYRAPGTCSVSSVFAVLATGVASGGPYTDVAPLVGSQCYYVTAVVNGVESPASNKVSLTSTVLPQPPTGLAATHN